jgi:SAM-dependent MidA family methyltransferase
MTALKERLAALIAQAGPITVAEYMSACLFDPDHGYYTTREPFGREGDFVTAPEVSQMFGELVAVWLYSAWRAAGAPRETRLVEIGPGRATLMADMIRTLARLDPGFVSSARFVLVEASPRLADIQRKTLAGSGATVEWRESLDGLPDQPTLFVGNEIFDALPARQFVRAGGAWRERCVGLDDYGTLRFVAGAGGLDPARLPPAAHAAPDGAILELSPAREAMMDTIAASIARAGIAGLFFDYGHLEPGLGDTLQAVRRHQPAGVLDDPGAADLTTHVDFSALAGVARGHGLQAPAMTQGEFLLAMGLLERAGRLGATADTQTRERLAGEAERLAAPGRMGDLFKVMALLPAGAGIHPFGSAD